MKRPADHHAELADDRCSQQPARMTHCTTAGSPFGVDSSLLRLSIGLEDCDELIADLDQALAV